MKHAGKRTSAHQAMVSLYLSVDRRHYFPYDVVSGRLTLKTKTPVHVRRLDVRVLKMQRLCVKEAGGQKRLVAGGEETSYIHDRSTEVMADDELSMGEHIFPFRFSIHGDDGGSTRLSGRFNDLDCSFENGYAIEAVYDGDAVPASALLDLTVFNRSDSLTFVDAKIKVQSFMCLLTSVYFYRITTDKALYNPGDLVRMRCFPTSIIKKSIVVGISVSLYEIIVFYNDGRRGVRSRPLVEAQGVRTERNVFEAQLRLPAGTSATVNEGAATVRVALFFNLTLRHQPPLKIKRYIDVGRPGISIPEIEEQFMLEGVVHNEQFIEF